MPILEVNGKVRMVALWVMVIGAIPTLEVITRVVEFTTDWFEDFGHHR